MVGDLRGSLCSVVIPAYNAADFVAETLDSALAQTYRPLEVITVDDGSTDETARVLAEYEPKITVLRKPNGGPASARNQALAVARGELVAFLDADDLWEPTRLERCIDLLAGHPEITMATADAFLIKAGVRTSRRVYGNHYRADFPEPAEQLRAIARANFLPSSIVMRRSLVASVGGFDEDRSMIGSEDYDLWIRLLLAGAHVGLVREPLGWYRVREDALSANVSAQWVSHLRVLEKNIPALWHSGVRAPGAVYFEIARRAARAGDARRGLRFGAMGLRCADLSVAQRVRAFGSMLRTMLRNPREAQSDRRTRP